MSDFNPTLDQIAEHKRFLEADSENNRFEIALCDMAVRTIEYEREHELRKGKEVQRMNSKSFRCGIGLHQWQEQVTVQWRMGFCTAFIRGDVCQRCGKHREDPYRSARGLPREGMEILGPGNEREGG